ncbi:MAG: hypothetical protein A2015_07485 [Spirochaetes bacterium GWF1_31_7]|nr:MAG: hypothetical protein A2Y30_02865 [Spirochaetes bacterium GWE1_32_154]OHD47599.1 MAG: hypothetical protein A2Y29_00310 [Spirochaetes bacterium GWE2_31_10]OHD51259.1 MAG: hypothetical protein A2015_07485 [Spirochaetes bacterium GWF1_31_7]OHD81611.1 MAG: hypothetical protein A2355_11030 [Spirochaetes bacterium RIFOXYB1_FULL_32_8]HBD96156.1 RNA polymerase subunit sigma-70 [Spirochaetia bacterium]
MKAVKDMDTIKYYFDDLKNDKLLSREEEIDLAKKIEAGDKTAVTTMIRSNLRLVIKIAKIYITNEWQLEDLIQEGNIGLMRAIEKFDYTKEVRFATYASWWIKQSIIRSLSNKRRAIRLPHRKEESVRLVKKMTSELFQKLNRSPSIKELASEMNYSETKIKSILSMGESIASLDAEINEDGLSLSSGIGDLRFSPEIVFNANEMITETDKVLEKLKQKEKFIIKQRFLSQGQEKNTLKSIAKDMGISPETVRQIEIKAISKIRSEYPYLKEYLHG